MTPFRSPLSYFVTVNSLVVRELISFIGNFRLNMSFLFKFCLNTPSYVYKYQILKKTPKLKTNGAKHHLLTSPLLDRFNITLTVYNKLIDMISTIESAYAKRVQTLN